MTQVQFSELKTDEVYEIRSSLYGQFLGSLVQINDFKPKKVAVFLVRSVGGVPLGISRSPREGEYFGLEDRDYHLFFSTT